MDYKEIKWFISYDLSFFFPPRFYIINLLPNLIIEIEDWILSDIDIDDIFLEIEFPNHIQIWWNILYIGSYIIRSRYRNDYMIQ